MNTRRERREYIEESGYRVVQTNTAVYLQESVEVKYDNIDPIHKYVYVNDDNNEPYIFNGLEQALDYVLDKTNTDMKGLIKVTGSELKDDPLYLNKEIVHWATKNKYTVKQFTKLMYKEAPALVQEFKSMFTTLKATPNDIELAKPIEPLIFKDE